MKKHSYTSEGIILSRRNYGETDRILTVFSKHYGKIILLAKGVRKLSSKKRGHLENFSRIKFSAVSGNGFDVMTEVDTIENFSSLKSNLNKMSLAYYFCEVVSKITREEEKQINVYVQLLKALEQLVYAKELKLFRKKFILNILIETGYWPNNKKMNDPDTELELILERKINSLRVGKRILR